jgi:hypothetical protein
VKNYNSVEKTNLTDHRINNLLSKFNSSISRMKHSKDGSIAKEKGIFFNELRENNNFNDF